MAEQSLLETLGGRPTLEKVHKVLYDKIYAHPWLKHLFVDMPQGRIENQLTDFMTSIMGGGKVYSGNLPQHAHKHIFIPEEMFAMRSELLQESLQECGVPEDLATHWLRIDEAFKASVVKKNESECEKRFNTDDILIVPKPLGL